MAEINKIRLGGSDYDIVPQLGTGLIAEEGVVGLNLGTGITFDENNRIAINLGDGLEYDEQNKKISINLGTAQILNDSNANSGIAINETGFTINPSDFKNYLLSLGVMFG